MKQNRYEPAKMEIILFEDCAFTDVVTSGNNDTGSIIKSSSRARLLSMYDRDNWYGDQ